MGQTGNAAGKIARQTIDEDLRVLPAMQNGMMSAEKPKGGLISIREERVFHFQKFVQSQLNGQENTNGAGLPTSDNVSFQKKNQKNV